MSLLLERFTLALAARLARLTPPHTTALRLFNGYTEGFPKVAVDLYGTTLVLHDATGRTGDAAAMTSLVAAARDALPFVTAVLWKRRESVSDTERKGTVLFGTHDALTRRVTEHGVWYATRLELNRDASLYLDTAPLRAWALANSSTKRVLNTFAYSGSLGVAAKAGGAERVVHTDLNREFLTVAKDSYALNRWPVARGDFITGDFFDVVGKLKREQPLFDLVFVDPPFFSVTEQGRVDLEQDLPRLINKVRPLVAHGGRLVVLNNGVFVSGAQFERDLATVCADGYMTVSERLDAPLDFVGHPSTRQVALDIDPAPYASSTKMAVLTVTRKDGRSR